MFRSAFTPAPPGFETVAVLLVNECDAAAEKAAPLAAALV